MNSVRPIRRMAQLAAVAAAIAGIHTGAAAQQWPFSSVSASSAVWPAANAIDTSVNSQWSSAFHSGPAATEWISGAYSAARQVNYIKLYPRMAGDVSYGFPEQFSVYGLVGSSWVLLRSYTGYPQPYRADHIVIPLSSPVNVTAIKVEATKLRADNLGGYYFQLGELAAGYDPLYSKLQYVGNNGNANEIEIRNLGSSAFHPSKMKVWNQDRRNPILTAKTPTGCAPSRLTRNVYAAQAVHLGGSSWRIVYGGEDGTCDQKDEIYTLQTNDAFASFGPRTTIIRNGTDTVHVNNPSFVKVGSSWRMLFTSARAGTDVRSCLTKPTDTSGIVDKPAYSVSSDGVTWNAANGSNLVNVIGYPTVIAQGRSCPWGDGKSGEDINGTNVILYDNGYWYLYIRDNSSTVTVLRSNDGVNFYYQQPLVNTTGDCYGVNDVKKINGYYVWAYGCNVSKLWYSVASSPMPPAIAAPTVLFDSSTAQPVSGADPIMVSEGWVTDGTRLLGVLYGATTDPEMWGNSIYARWLQKRAKLANAYTSLEWTKANGPDNGVIMMVPGSPLETGNVTVYDSDGTTVLHTSPKVTMRQGDVWQYVP